MTHPWTSSRAPTGWRIAVTGLVLAAPAVVGLAILLTAIDLEHCLNMQRTLVIFIGGIGSILLFMFSLFAARSRAHRLASEQALRETIDVLREKTRSLAEARHEVQLLNAELEARVEYRTQQVRELLHQKRCIINQLGHDLKTPLTPLVALMPRLLNAAPDEATHRTAEVLAENVRYMRELVEKTLDLANIESETFRLSPEPVDVESLFNNLALSFRSTLEDAGLALEWQVPQPCPILADPLQLKEVLHNLLANAIRYTPSGGYITLSARREQEGVQLSVSDTGVGIDPQQCEQVFEEFYKADTARNDRSTSGLGLSICRRLIDAHGGQIWIESSGHGQGTTVHCLLPAAEPAKV